MTLSRISTPALFAGVLLIALNTAAALAQPGTYIQSVKPQSASEGEPLTISVSLAQTSSLSRVMLFYRQLGASDFRSAEMQIARDSASAEIPASEIAPPFVEFYLVAETQTGVRETYPLSSPQTTPARVTILPRSAQTSDVLILSPETDAPVAPDELYISLSFVYAGSEIAIEKTKIFLNSVDLSPNAVAAGDLLLVSPEAIPDQMKSGGSKRLRIELYDAKGALIRTINRTITVAGAAMAESGPEFLFNGSGQTESRSESIKGASKTYNRFDVRANAQYGILKTTANLQLTSEEKPENQPQNRYYVGFDAKYLKLGFGDTYPQFPTALMDGRRVRGVSAEASYGILRLAAASGEIVRGVDYGGQTLSNRRTLTVVRPSFGKGDRFQWGFTYLHSKDGWNAGSSKKPQENVVAGTDLLVALDDRRIEWKTQASMSINNLDISSPEFTRDSIDAAVARGTLSSSEGDDLKKLLPLASKFITFNENITPLNPTGLSSLAFETALSLNYFNNYLRGSYLYHGSEYMSFGTASFRRDVQGYNITDRLRLLGNSLFVTGSFEQLGNNVTKYDPVTTTWTTATASVSYFAAGRIPDITLGISSSGISNDNLPVDSLRSALLPQIDYATTRVFLQSTYSFAWMGQHLALLSVDYSGADDKSVRNQDITGFNGMLFVTTEHTKALESTIGLTTSLNTLPANDTGAVSPASTTMNYSTLTLGAGYRFLEDRMKATVSLAPTFGNYRRTQMEAGVQYALFARHTIAAQYRYIVNSSLQPTPLMPRTDDSAFTISYRMNF
ncbi:MAG: hypothetical protein ACM3Q4_04680 [Acidobacteriota bacterium]